MRYRRTSSISSEAPSLQRTTAHNSLQNLALAAFTRTQVIRVRVDREEPSNLERLDQRTRAARKHIEEYLARRPAKLSFISYVKISYVITIDHIGSINLCA